MNKSIIKEIFAGKRGTYEQLKFSQDYEQSKKKMCDAVDVFLEKLSAEQQKLFHETYEFICDKEAESGIDHFVEGFKVGLLLGIETGQS